MDICLILSRNPSNKDSQEFCEKSFIAAQIFSNWEFKKKFLKDFIFLTEILIFTIEDFSHKVGSEAANSYDWDYCTF